MNYNALKIAVIIIAFLFGCIGAVGEAFILLHELVDCLPYKVVDYELYLSIGETGLYVAPLAGIVTGLVASLAFRRKGFWYPLAMPVILTPLFFAVVFLLLSNGRPIESEMTGDFTYGKAEEQFYSNCFILPIWGAAIAGIIGGMLTLILRYFRKLP